MLDSRHPMFVWWGNERTNFYNDAYVPVLGKRHPAALGQSAREVWYEIWDLIGPQSEAILREGSASWHDQVLLIMERNGYPEETYFTFSHSPIREDDGGIGGVFCACREDTARVLSQRRMKSLRELGVRTTDEATTAESACRAAAATLCDNPNDLPFALLYLLDGTGLRAKLVAATRLEPGTRASPEVIELGDPRAAWPLAALVATGEAEAVDRLSRRFGPLPGGAWPESPEQAFLLPLARHGRGHLAGFLVAGLSPRLDFDDDYRGFLELTAAQVATAIANARGHEAERQRAKVLAELDRAKTAFFSNVSHELRTPLTLILGPVEDALNDSVDPLSAGQSERQQVVHRSAVRLLKLVDSLLDFSRIEAGRIQACYAPTDVASLTAGTASAFRSLLERAGLELTIACPALSEPVYVDRQMWERIVLNLVSNAFKFTFHGEIQVRVERAAGTVRLVVKDTGTGIEEQHLPRVFERFYRIEGARGRACGGSGIGLALVKELVKLHGGSIRVESTVGKGSTFTVSVPVGTAHLAPERLHPAPAPSSLAVDATAYVEEALGWVECATDFEAGSPSAEELPGALASGFRVLVADDNADMRAYLDRLLRPIAAVEAVADGAQALAAIRRRPPDLLLCDVMMPNLDGLELVRAVREDARTRVLPIVLLSAKAGEEARVEGASAGADDYVTKPFSARELTARVRTQLELSRQRKRSEEALRQSEERFRVAVEATRAMVYDHDVRSGRILSPHGCQALLGWEPAEEDCTLEGWDRRIHPDDLPRCKAALQGMLGDPRPRRLEYRVRHGDGRWVYVEDFAKPVCDESGQVVRIIGSAVDITERKRAEEALRKANAELADADLRKNDFMAMLSHELRNPLAPIKNGLYVLDRAKPGSEQASRAKAVIERQVDHLTHLVDDLLDVTRVARGKIRLEVERLDFGLLVRRTVEDFRSLFVESGLELSLGPFPAEAWIRGDRTRIAQVVANLLQNAAKFTPSGGAVAVFLRRTEGRTVRLQVRDTGAGLAPEIMPRLFEPFTQADSTLDRSRGGLGLGLALVKGLVEKHGGSVSVESDGPGKGSQFTVVLPLEDRAPAEQTSTAAAREEPVARRFLVIEDNVDAADSLRAVLELAGNAVEVAYDGLDGLEKARSFRPDVILCDVGLPQMDGYAVAKAVRADPALAAATMIALTGYARPEDVARSREAGFDHHMAKPLCFAELERLLALEPPKRCHGP
jgi:PAS domain S-box-containing protein